jgi:hypothetical protein
LTYFLDESRHDAVRMREERNSAGQLLVRCRNSHFSQVDGRPLWLPRTCDVEYYTWPSMQGEVSPEPLFKERYTLLTMDARPIPPHVFDLGLRYNAPGTEIADATLPGASSTKSGFISYRIPAPSDEADESDGVTPAGMASPRLRLLARAWLALLVVGLCALLIGGALWYVRGRRKARSSVGSGAVAGRSGKGG